MHERNYELLRSKFTEFFLPTTVKRAFTNETYVHTRPLNLPFISLYFRRAGFVKDFLLLGR